MYKNQRSDKDDDTYEMVKRKNIQLLLRHYTIESLLSLVRINLLRKRIHTVKLVDV